MATTYRYQAVVWSNEEGLHSGRLVDDDSDGTAVGNSKREVLKQLKEYLTFVHSDGVHYMPEPDFLEPQLRKVKLHIYPEYVEGRENYACKESVALKLPCALGKRSGGLYVALLPTIDVEFSFSDLRSF